MRWPPVLAAATGALVVAGFALGGDQNNLHNALIAVSAFVMGAAIERFHPGHLEGRLLMVVGTVHGVLFSGRAYGRHPSAFAARWITWLGVWPLAGALVLVAATVMCYPDGHLPGRRWATALGALGAIGALLMVASALWGVEHASVGVAVDPPFVVPGRRFAQGVYDVARPAGYTAIQVVWAACVVTRLLRARGTEARQMRWFVLAVVLNLVVLVGGLVATGRPRAALLTVPLLPVAAGIGIIAGSYETLLADLRAANKRIVTAHDDARRRIERDLHDGVQHRLLVLGIELGRLVDHAEARGAHDLATGARSSREQLLAATAELRELARGIHPAALTEDGLEAALGVLADRSPIPVQLHVALGGGPGPSSEATETETSEARAMCQTRDVRTGRGGALGREVEAAAYFVASESLTNAARHSGASRVSVRATRQGDALELDVVDDGVGGATLVGGLQGLADRVSSLGGRFDVTSPPGHGTHVRAVIPCG